MSVESDTQGRPTTRQWPRYAPESVHGRLDMATTEDFLQLGR